MELPPAGTQNTVRVTTLLDFEICQTGELKQTFDRSTNRTCKDNGLFLAGTEQPGV